ncbi:PolC-type DNA polymerase III [Niallia sp. NCCP-28]|uniref:3'-5' exonuclease n=1 Tax=Niallia sp. NCCP-28 TaxID=2934712 RepID=UPI002085BA4C|nr:3'-5' exonuclease [Niallia sp. NCCP-28]GKU82693.1 hypothetical protein NCCP28_20890 [Niallia sp. NCCP-28]
MYNNQTGSYYNSDINKGSHCAQCNSELPTSPIKKIHDTVFCKSCFDLIKSNYASIVGNIYETIFKIHKSKDLFEKKELLHELINVTSQLRKEKYFDYRINDMHIDDFRVQCLRDYALYNNTINNNRKKLTLEEKEKVQTTFIQQKKPYDRYIAFDLETTGLSPEKHEIIEIGAVKIIHGYAVEYFQCFVKTKKKSTKKIIQITGITDHDLETEGIPLNEALEKLSEFIQSYPLIAHNAPFDINFIKQYGAECNIKFNNKVDDTLALAKRYMKDVRSDGYSYKLSDLCDYIGYKPEKSHRSYDDALAAAFLYESIKIDIKFKREFEM